MPASPAAGKILDREFLEIRSKLIDLGALLDRVGRGPGVAAGDQRMDKIGRALEILAGGTPDRAEQIQIVFSLPYDEHWRR